MTDIRRIDLGMPEHEILCNFSVAADSNCVEIIGVAHMLYYGRENLNDAILQMSLETLADKMANLQQHYSALQLLINSAPVKVDEQVAA